MVPLNRAVPSLGLLRQDSRTQLALERSSWMHLLSFAERAASLPAEPGGASATTREAIAQLRLALQAVGSPGQVRFQLSRDPGLLAQQRPPDGIYAGVLWLARRLHVGAAAMTGFMQSLEHTAEPLPAAACKRGLLRMGSMTAAVRSGIAAFAYSLKSTTPRLLAANDALAAAYQADAKCLQDTHQTLGALQAQIDGVQKQLRELGWLGSLSRKAPLERELRALHADQARNLAQVEILSPLIGQLAAVLDEGAWLPSALRDLTEFVDQVGKVWTQVGSGLAQLATDASTTQLENPLWLRAALGLDGAMQEWRAICAAAEQFVAAALVQDGAAREHLQSLIGSDTLS